MVKKIESIVTGIVTKPSYVVLVILAVLFTFVTVKFGLLAGALFCLLPFFIIIFFYFLDNPKASALLLFAFTYFSIGLTRYIPGFKAGVVFDVAFIFLLILIVFHGEIGKKIKWIRSFNWIAMMFLVWAIYCVIMLFNPYSLVFEAWLTNVRWVALYPLALFFVVPLLITEKKDVKYLVNIFAVIVLIAIAKAFYQKFVGFDVREKYYLYVMGMAKTHLISSGARYFSLFSDAANFGASMGLSSVLFGVMIFYVKSKGLKLFYLIVSALSLYGLFISGTRSALFIPVVAVLVFVVLSKKKSLNISLIIMLIVVIAFLKFTQYGNGSRTIRRMRSVFDKEDASMNVRRNNKKMIYSYMSDKPFGIGIGMGGHKARVFAPGSIMSQTATDSQFIKMLVETGYIGVTIYVLLLVSILIYGSYLSLFKIRDVYLKGIDIAVVAMLAGIMVNAYVNEVLLQFPNGIIIFTFISVLAVSPRLDQEVTPAKLDE